MTLLVLRSLAVYGGTAALSLVLAHRFVESISRKVAAALVLVPLLFTGRALLTGGVYGPIDILYDAFPFGAHRQELQIPPSRSPILSDVVYQEIPWRAAVRRAFAERRLPLWNPSVLVGEPLLAVQQGAVLHPATWIGCLLPLPQAWTFEMTLRIFLALLSAHLFFRDLRCGTMAALLGALGWAFCDYLVFYLGYPLTPAAAPFPLLLLGLRRIVREPDRRSIAITVVAVFLIVSSGHPETLLHASAGAGAYFLFELALAPRGRRLRSLLGAAGAGAFAMGLSAVLLLPLAEALPRTAEHWARSVWYAHQPRAVAPEQSAARLVPQVMPYAVGVSGHGRQMPDFQEPRAYAGSLLLPFALAGLFSRCRLRWFFLGLALAGLAVSTRTVAAQALAKVPLFDIALNERLVFLTSFSVCALAALGANRLREGEGARAFLAGAVGSVGILSWLFVRYRSRMEGLEMPSTYARERFLLQVVPLVAAIALVAVLSRKHRARAGLAAVVALFAAQRTLEAGSLDPTMPARAFYPPLAVLSKIPRGEPFRTVGLYYAFVPNVAAVYELEDARGYEAMTLRPLSETFPLWCVHQPVWYNRVEDPTTPFLSFLNVRWVLSPLDRPAPPGWLVIAEEDGLRLLENPRALPRAFVPPFLRAEPDPERRLDLLGSIRDFGERGVVSESSAAGDWIENGEARLRIEAYRPQAMDVDVDARGQTLVATSIPAWPGWKARVDGKGIDAVGYNHAFLAFRVPAGRHRLTLRYFPDSVRNGLAVSTATLLLSLWLLLAPRKRGLSQNPG